MGERALELRVPRGRGRAHEAAHPAPPARASRPAVPSSRRCTLRLAPVPDSPPQWLCADLKVWFRAAQAGHAPYGTHARTLRRRLSLVVRQQNAGVARSAPLRLRRRRRPRRCGAQLLRAQRGRGGGRGGGEALAAAQRRQATLVSRAPPHALRFHNFARAPLLRGLRLGMQAQGRRAAGRRAGRGGPRPSHLCTRGSASAGRAMLSAASSRRAAPATRRWKNSFSCCQKPLRVPAPACCSRGISGCCCSCCCHQPWGGGAASPPAAAAAVTECVRRRSPASRAEPLQLLLLPPPPPKQGARLLLWPRRAVGGLRAAVARRRGPALRASSAPGARATRWPAQRLPAQALLLPRSCWPMPGWSRCACMSASCQGSWAAQMPEPRRGASGREPQGGPTDGGVARAARQWARDQDRPPRLFLQSINMHSPAEGPSVLGAGPCATRHDKQEERRPLACFCDRSAAPDTEPPALRRGLAA